MTTTKHTRRVVLFGLLAASLSCTASAQDAESRKEKFVNAQRVNKEALTHYSWTSTTTLALKGEVKSTKVNLEQYDAQGQLLKTPIDQPQPEEAHHRGRRRHRVREHVVDKKKKEYEELLKGLAQLISSYTHLPPDKTQAFAKNAEFSQGQGEMQGTIRIQGADVLQPGDSLSVWVDPRTDMMRKVEISTFYEGKPASAVTSFADLPDGPTCPAQTVLTYPAKQIEVTTANDNYQRLGS